MLWRNRKRTMGQVLTQLTKRHGKMLKQGEVFLAACDAFGADEAHPPPLAHGRRQPPSVDADDDLLRAEAAARDRLASVATTFGVEGFSELPYSNNGYLLTHTDRRMLIFNGTGKDYLLQSPIIGVWLTPVDHGDDGYTLILTSAEDRVALATRRESVEMTREFIASFPDRRDAARRVIADASPRDVEF